jgi:hypothetical protein
METLTTQSELVKFFYANTKAVRGNIVTRTPVKMNKKDVATKQIANPHGAIYKVQTINVELNPQYEMQVNTARMLEGKEQDFEVSARKWGVHVNGGIIEKNGQLYLNVIEEAKVGTAVYETENGVEVKYADFAAFMPAYVGAVKQGLETDIKIRTFKLENVIGMFIPSIQVRYNPNK